MAENNKKQRDLNRARPRTFNKAQFISDVCNDKYILIVGGQVILSRETFPELNPTWLMTGKGDMFGGVSELVREVERLREENKRLREMKLPATDVAPIAELWMRFMANQQQYNEIMREMVELYKK